jgi:hypothetical protein
MARHLIIHLFKDLIRKEKKYITDENKIQFSYSASFIQGNLPFSFEPYIKRGHKVQFLYQEYIDGILLHLI